MSLIEMQRDMHSWLVQEDEDAATRLGLASAPGLRIHLNNYRAQLIACLRDSFTCTLAWLGEEAFEGAAATHIDRVPPSSWTLDAYPRDFPATLAALYSDDPEVAELAWLEAALSDAFVAPDGPALTLADLADVNWDSAALIFTPTLDLGALTTNAPAIWSSLTEGETPPPAELLPEPGAILVWRHEQLSRFRALDRVEHQALLQERAGMSFAGLCEIMVSLLGEDDGVILAGQLLARWTADGLLAAVKATTLK